MVSTRQGDKVFVHVLRWDANQVRVPSPPRKVVRASLLSGGKVEVVEQDGQLLISVPQKSRKALDTIVALTLDGSAMDIPPIAIPDKHPTGAK